MEEILKYFKELTEEQIRQLTMLDELYHEWNAKINVISRKDIDHLYEHHVLHSLSIALLLHFKPNTKILDFGTGGGFPGIPLAILFPECQFTLIDGTGKKIRVATEISNALNLQNVEAKQIRGEEEHGKFHFIVSRAVMPLADMSKIVLKNIEKKQTNVLPNGIICLKGGSLEDEIGPYHHIAEVTPISNWFEEEWFKEKNIVYLPL
ncbi:MAG: 16S rRNA (guanine(527)-N(7))-methyltransferase RsmG [Prevotella sp.]